MDEALELIKRQEYSGEIIVDHGRTNYTRRKPSNDVRIRRERYYSGSESDPDDTESDDENINRKEKPLDALDNKSTRFSFRTINPKMQKELSPEHYRLLPRAVAGFALSQKQKSISTLE